MLGIAPMVTSACVQEHRDEEEVDEATSDLDFFCTFPLLDQIGNSRYVSDLKMLPATMRWYGIEFVRAEISLSPIQ